MPGRPPAPISRSTALLLGALCFAAPAAAQRAGVLLGFEDGSTLWVAPDPEGRVRALRSDTLLIVPRRDGFWKVGTSVTVGARAARRGGARRFARRPQCYELEYNPTWFELAAWAAPLTRAPYVKLLPDSTAASLRRMCGTRDIAFTFVGSEHVSLDENYVTEYGGGLMNIVEHAALVPLDSLARRGYAALLDESWNVELAPGDSATEARLIDECRTSEHAATIDELIASGMDFVDRNYVIRRTPGRWQLVLRLARGGAAWRGLTVECETSHPLPASVVGHDALPLRFEAIKRQVPEARDAVGSPDGDMLVVLGAGKLLVFAPHGTSLGAPVAELPAPPCDLVLAQWATGAHVARWSAQLAPYLVTTDGDRRGRRPAR